MSDLVRKTEATGKTPKKDPALSFAKMGPLLGETPPPEPSQASVPSEPLYEVVQQEIARILESGSQGKPFAIAQMQAALGELVRALATGDALLLQALGRAKNPLDLPTHLVNVTIFAIKIGRGIGFADEDLRRLALAACLHDVGMVSIPQPILEKADALSADEMALVRRHPEKGFRILQSLGPEFKWLATIALQEQEREDGSGYPHGLTGDQIHEFARIIGLADLYDALIHPRPYQKREAPADAVKEIITNYRRLFAGRILKGLIQGLSTFPVGSLVRLNSHEVARVVATNPSLPLRPVVEVLTGPQGERLASARRVNLAENTLLYIMESVTDESARGSGAA